MPTDNQSRIAAALERIADALEQQNAAMAAGETMLTVATVAKALKASPATVRGWITGGELKAANLAREGCRPRYAITPDDLESFRLSRIGTANEVAAKPPTSRRLVTKSQRY